MITLPVVRGVSFLKYIGNADEIDPDGSLGHSLADAYVARYGFSFPSSQTEKSYDPAAVARFVLTPLPRRPGHKVSYATLQDHLATLGNMGYPIPSQYRDFNRAQLVSYLTRVQAKARQDFPGVLAEIIRNQTTSPLDDLS